VTHQKQLLGIQYLRGIAATSVVVFHLSMQLNRIDSNSSTFSTFQYGVDLFFVISGFVMVYSTNGGVSLTSLKFFRKRLIRIAPLYWLATAAAATVLAFAPQLVRTTAFSSLHIVSSFLFFPLQNLKDPIHNSPIVAVGWTLNYEMFFYFLFAIGIAASRKKPYRTVIVTSITILILIALGQLYKPTNEVFRFYTNPIMLEFVFGMVIGSLTLDDRQNALLMMATLAALITMIALPDQGESARSIIYAPLASLVVGSAISAYWPKNNFLLLVGDASYSIYISHFFIVSAYAQIWDRVLGIPSSVIAECSYYLIGLVMALAAGIACRIFVETPLLNIFLTPSKTRSRETTEVRNGVDITTDTRGSERI